MSGAPRPSGRPRSPHDPPQPPRTSDEWRLWRTFGLGLALLIFLLVAVSVSL